ncbi:hypothetical protein [Coleofasciculus sp. F4-SAH-05]
MPNYTDSKPRYREYYGLSFYRLVPNGIEVMRVVGGYRDLEALFVEDDQD